MGDSNEKALRPRYQVINQLVGLITQINRPHPVRVAVDGIDAAGKTTLADELVRPIEDRGRPVIRASIDGFHHPRSKRYERGTNSPESYYFDSFDYGAIRSELLIPLGPGGSRQYRRAIFDFRSDSPLQASVYKSPANAILLFDGVFLLRPELNDYWDFRIFLEVDFDEAIRRALQRDLPLFRSADEVMGRYRARYLPGQQMYLQAVHPQKLADVVMKNSNPSRPRLLVRSRLS